MSKRWINSRDSILHSLHGRGLVKFVLISALSFISNTPSAQIPPAGTIITNAATSTQQVGAVAQTSPSNSVFVVVGGAPAPFPVLTKNFSAPSIPLGGSAGLVFQISNSAGNPAQSGMAFVDTLAGGLRLTTGATSLVSGAGCAASVVLSAPSTISVSAGSMSAGTVTCQITINGVTNASPNGVNNDCSSNPPAFTNGPSSISGLVNVSNGVTNRCLVIIGPPGKPNLDMSLIKSLSANSGTSPSGAYTVRIRYLNVSSVEGRKTDVAIVDTLPAGMLLIPGTLKVFPTGGPPTISLPNSSGTFSANGSSATYSAEGNTIRVGFASLEQGEWGLIEFDINIAAGIAVDTVIRNIAQVSYLDFEGKPSGPKASSPSEFRITGNDGVELRGMTIPTAEPGSTVTFENLLTNTGARSDTFDISLSGSNYPSGTVFKLFKADGVTPLADSNGNGIPDTGVVAAGGTFKIVVKAQLPNGSSGGPYSINKSAQSISNPLVRAVDADILTTIGMLCRMVLEPNNSGTVTAGGAIVYTHVLTNIGNCTETVTIPSNFLANTSNGWVAQLFVDNATAGGQSIVGILDAGDSIVSTTTTISVPPGGRVVFLVRVTAPTNSTIGAGNTTNIRVTGGASGVLTVNDVSTISNGPVGIVSDEITGFVDSTFLRPSVLDSLGSQYIFAPMHRRVTQIRPLSSAASSSSRGPAANGKKSSQSKRGPIPACLLRNN